MPKCYSPKPGIPIEKVSDEDLEAEIEYWTDELRNATSWGAAITFANECQKDCYREIERRKRARATLSTIHIAPQRSTAVKLQVEITEPEIRKILSAFIYEKFNVEIKPELLNIEVKSRQNYRSEWETADIRLNVSIINHGSV